ncbi:EF-hand domain-containing protein, partial [Salmonella enterica]|uniref:EF-hand domain-containing protein n=1 Tax=Salmonella enterica TaxID=28901 RepID=UPI0020C475BA
MLVRILIAAGTVIALSAPAMAQSASAPAVAGMTLQQFQAENGDKWFARMDANKDGRISPEEFEAFRNKSKTEAPATASEAPAGKSG